MRPSNGCKIRSWHSAKLEHSLHSVPIKMRSRLSRHSVSTWLQTSCGMLLHSRHYKLRSKASSTKQLSWQLSSNTLRHLQPDLALCSCSKVRCNLVTLLCWPSEAPLLQPSVQLLPLLCAKLA